MIQNSEDVASDEDGIASLFSFGFLGSIYEVTYPGRKIISIGIIFHFRAASAN